jgi:hypothetical protein
LCFFLRMRLRRFLISDPISTGTLAEQGVWRHALRGPIAPLRLFTARLYWSSSWVVTVVPVVTPRPRTREGVRPRAD